MTKAPADPQAQLDLGHHGSPMSHALALQSREGLPRAAASLSIDDAMAVYRDAIDPAANPMEGAAWWGEVHAELEQVLAAPTLHNAAQVIDWWHRDWSMVGDTATAAARRLRASARRILGQTRGPRRPL